MPRPWTSNPDGVQPRRNRSSLGNRYRRYLFQKQAEFQLSPAGFLAIREDPAAIVKAVTGLGKSSGILTTAEGVEMREQLAVLRSEGCNEVQGYLFNPPRPASEVEKMLSDGGLRVVA